MAWKWGKASKDRLATCDKRLQDLADMMLSRSPFDLSVICGFRTEQEQNEAFEKGKSRAKFGQSKHNTFPSKAIDIVPCSPINWDKKDIRWWNMVALAYDCARELNIKIRSGAFFNGLEDFPHIEILE